MQENIKQDSLVKKSKWKTFLGILIGILILLSSLVAAGAWYIFYTAYIQLEQEEELFIMESNNLDLVIFELKERGLIRHEQGFRLTAQVMKYKGKQGRYVLPKNITNNYELIRRLRGKRSPVKVTFNNCRFKEQFAGQIAKHLSCDSAEIADYLNNTAYLTSLGLNEENAMSILIPNTYEMYWMSSAEEVLTRMEKEHKRFWNKDRLNKAKALEMSPSEVYTLASIVEKESQYNPEKPRIAGVYLNRLQQKWKLQADPTVVYATGDFSIKRVLNRHLETDSPYNTYMYEGLPPGPIYMPSISSIDAVLNAEKHDYMYFCAKVPRAGESASHAFAKTHRAHINNAQRYHRWLSKQGY